MYTPMVSAQILVKTLNEDADWSDEVVSQIEKHKYPYFIQLQGLTQIFRENPLISPQSHSLDESIRASFY